MQTVRLGHKSLEDSISDNIRIILFTGRGEDPFRPRFGLGAERLLGGGMTNIDVAYEVADQLSTYEQRVDIKQVFCQSNSEGVQHVTINYEIIQTRTLTQITI